jgi:hypothetical protein
MTTLGEDRVRVGFNPNSNDLVDQIKRKTETCVLKQRPPTSRLFQECRKIVAVPRQ